MVNMAAQGSNRETVARATHATASAMQPQWVPVNAHAAPGALVVVAPLPAVMPDDITIELGPDTLRISARLRSSGPREYLLHEWEYGGYEREIDLPEGFRGGLEASLTNGQLVVRVLRGPFTGPVSVHPHDLPTERGTPGESAPPAG
jgi:HSP20 family molecular chaperone IbpA